MDFESLPEGKLVELYLKLRDKHRLIKKEHEKQLAPVLSAMLNIETELHRRLHAAQVNSLKLKDSGTAYISRTHTAPVQDRSAFLDFVIQHEAWELLDIKANANAVLTYVEEKGELPSGVELKAREKVNIRKS